MKIQNALRGIALAVAAASLALVLAPGAALATEYEAVSADVPATATVTVTGDENATAPDEEFTFVLVDEAGETVDSATAAAGEEVTLATPGAAQVGQYCYTLYQVAGTTDGMTYDEQVFDVVVYVLWDEGTDTLYTIVYVFNAEGYKCVAAEFANEYYVEPVEEEPEEETTESLTKTGDAGVAAAVALGFVGGVAVACAVLLARRSREEHTED